jgi:molecular chaperone HtpG
MKKVLTKRVLDELARKAKEDGYEKFWSDFGPVLKEGLYEDQENREKLLEIARFRTTNDADWTTLEAYLGRMKEGQDEIYYITGESVAALRTSPQLEVARAKGVEVLLFEDAVDEFWLPEMGPYQGKTFKSLTKSDVDLSKIKGETTEPEPEMAPEEQAKLDKLVAKLKLTLTEQVQDVRVSKRLRESAVCLVAPDQGMDLRLERLLKHHESFAGASKPILEVNPDHELIKKLETMLDAAAQESELDDMAYLLLDQARIIEGEPVPDPGAFSRRMSRYLAKGLAAA